MLGIVPQVRLGDRMSGEEHCPDPIGSCGPDSHLHALESLRHIVDTTRHADPTFVTNAAYQVGWFVLHGWKDFGKRSLAHLVFAGRSSKVKGLMGPLQVVDVAPAGRRLSGSAPDQ